MTPAQLNTLAAIEGNTSSDALPSPLPVSTDPSSSSPVQPSSTSTSPPSSSPSSSDNVDATSSADSIISAIEIFDNAEEVNKLRVLLTMSLGSSRDLTNDDRLKGHVNSGRVEKTQVLLRGKMEYNKEIIRRAKYLISDVAKQPRPTAWKNPKRLEWLKQFPFLVSTGCKELRDRICVAIL